MFYVRFGGYMKSLSFNHYRDITPVTRLLLILGPQKLNVAFQLYKDHETKPLGSSILTA